MLRKAIKIGIAGVLLVITGSIGVFAQPLTRDYDNDDYVRIDRYLDVEIWTDHHDGEYFVGDDIVVYFRASRDAFVAIYSLDSRGRVNLLFPSAPTEDNFISGGVTYSLPGADEDYDLIVTGPDGIENIQIIGSRERFPVPNWYHNSGLVCDWDSRSDFMDHVNNTHFVRYGGQRFAYDRAVVFVDEWEPDYYQPVHVPYYPSWTVCGNVYIDYPWGATVYVNGIYWGCAPLYVPRIAVGWHIITIYDYYGSCWETDFHVSRYNTVVFNEAVVQPGPKVVSRFKEVHRIGYRDPLKHGYPNYKTKNVVTTKTVARTTGLAAKKTSTKTTVFDEKSKTSTSISYRKSHLKGSAKLVKTSRGYETDMSTGNYSAKKHQTKVNKTNRSRTTTSIGSSKSQSKSKSTVGKSDYGSKGKNSTSDRSVDKKRKTEKSTSSEYYQRKTSSKSKSTSKSSKSIQRKSTKKSGNSSSLRKSTKSSGSSKSIQSSSKSGTKSKSSGNKVTSPSTKSGSSAVKSSGSSSTKSTVKKSGGKNRK